MTLNLACSFGPDLTFHCSTNYHLISQKSVNFVVKAFALLKWSFWNDYELPLSCTAVICSERLCTVEDCLTDFYLVDQSKFKLTNQNSGSKNKSKLHVCNVNEPKREGKAGRRCLFFNFYYCPFFPAAAAAAKSLL